MSVQESTDAYSDYSDSEPEIDLIDDLDDVPRDNFRDPMIPEHCIDQSEALALFSENFERRYGPTHPIFFCGSMQEVINQSTKGEFNDRRPVAVYLHHDRSISSNIFCQRTLCNGDIANYLSANYLTWAWDMTMPTNTTRFLDNISLNFGEEVRNQLSAIGPSNFPLLLIFQKKPGAQLEIATMITIDTATGEAMSILAAGFEQHLALIDELRSAEEARLDRERIKEEQDTAYLASKERDREIMKEKEKEHLQRIHSAEFKLREKAMAQDSQDKAARDLPDEPVKGPGTTTIRFRFPSGEIVNRRFLHSDMVGILFTFAHAKGFPPNRHRIILNFPKKDLRDVPSNTSLKECGLVPQALVYVEEDFDES